MGNRNSDPFQSIADVLNDVCKTDFTAEELKWRAKHPGCAALGHTPEPGGFCPECRPDKYGGRMVTP